ncbi:MAG: HAD family acid phosphatase [Jatrophihabitans sp.]|uniref:HAD family acid phosphatase n=1 Tax=Jatrophihabitans sp. TaxID=1932789 RepID=UPI003F8182B5
MSTVLSAARRPRAVGALLAVLTLLLLGLVSGSASAHRPTSRAVPPPPAQPTSADQIQNIDQVKTAIKAYYGDTVTGATNPDGTPEHTFAPNGAYAHEVQSIATYAANQLWGKHHGKPTRHAPGHKAVLFDIDDTTLNTYNYEIASNFVYNPAQNALFVNNAAFPAVPGMVALEHAAEAHGYTVFFLTGRPIAQHDGTVANLTDVGYDVTDANLYLKDQTKPWLSSCAPTCTTIQYKSLTRAHIESLGYDIVANFGDQYSDLKGGYADSTYKIPNPMYYLP